MNAAAAKVFISYRREDAAGHAGRLYDALAARFGERSVLMDVDLKPGVDFVDQIIEAVGECDVLLVVIGPRWARHSATEATDFVWLEVETGLRRPDVRVIPLLVAGAPMPEPEDLPESVRAVARRNALVLSDMGWRQDVQRLMATLVEALEGSPAESARVGAPARRRSRVRWIGAAAVAAVLAAVLVYVLAGRDGGPSLVPSGHRLVAQRSILARNSQRYTLALSVPKGAASVPLTMSLFAARGTEPSRLVERKPLPDRYRFTKQAYVVDFRLAPNADESVNVTLAWFNVPGDTTTETTCYMDLSLAQISNVGCS